MQDPTLVHYLPIATTAICAVFAPSILRRYRQRGRGAHLLWWAAGVLAYGSGTALESIITLFGNTLLLNKLWYVAGAVLGAYPLAQGSVFLLLRRKTALRLTWISLPVVTGMVVLVLCSPTDAAQLETHRPSGAILGWTWLRALTPLVNGYAALFLVGGAILSAVRYARHPATRDRFLGNSLIAVGAILPGIGGGMAKSGMVEALYIAELVGIVLIWAGHRLCIRPVTEPAPG